MEYYGVHGVALKLFQSYLSNRKQVTSIDSFISALDLIEWGVPQGSVLGPLLFLIFINDIHYASDLGTWLFADDTSLVSSAESLTELQLHMNQQVTKVQDWLLANKLSVHYAKKSQYMLINSNPSTRIYEHFELVIVMGDHIIERTNKYRYLGILVDDRFSWADHITEVCQKLSQVAGVIFKTRQLLSKQALKLVYHSLAGSKLRYGLICWATARKFLLNKVNIVHNRIITYMSFSKRCTRMWPLFCQLKVLPLDILIQIEYGKTMYKYQNNMLPSIFNTYFNKPTHSYPTRFSSNNNFALTRANSARDKQMLKVIGPSIWLGIPIHIKDSMSLKVFVKSYRNYLIGNYNEN